MMIFREEGDRSAAAALPAPRPYSRKKAVALPDLPPCKLAAVPACTYHIGSSKKKHYTATGKRQRAFYSFFLKEFQQ
jgi:hypothetical protein